MTVFVWTIRDVAQFVVLATLVVGILACVIYDVVRRRWKP